MVFVILVGSALLAAGPARVTLAPPDLTPPDLEAYEAARSSVGRDPEAQVKLALWCEAHGLQAERVKHLALAVMADPANATARGLLGLVAYRGRWQRPDAVGEKVQQDPELSAVLAEYNARRDKADRTAESQWRLALWCEERGLKPEATAHLTTVVRLDPRRDAAWKRLGYKKHAGRWMTPEQIAGETTEAERQKQADQHWKRELERLRERLSDRGRRLDAEQALTRITDPRAVPMVCQVFGRGTAAQQRIAVYLLAQIDAPTASRALAVLAIFGRDPEVRRVAAEVLVRRDPREFAGLLVGLLGKSIKYEVRPVAGPGSPGELFVEGKRFNVRRLYSPPSAPAIQPGDQISLDAAGLPVATRTLGYFWTPPSRPRGAVPSRIVPSDPRRLSQIFSSRGLGTAESQELGQLFASTAAVSGIPVIRRGAGNQVSFEMPRQLQIPVGQMALEAQQAARAAEGQLESDVAAIQQYNAPILETNGRVLPLLAKIAGEDLGEDPETWSRWAVDLAGYSTLPQKSSEEPPTVVQQVPIAFQPQAAPVLGIGAPVAARVGHSCFGRGTAVTTLLGPRPIESLQVGDQVLTQDGRTGALTFQPVVVVYHNSPNQTLRIRFSDETVEVTGIHRFWKAGHGWIMARDLDRGDTVRTIGGVATVAAIESGLDQPVFNLEVARGQSFFVGRAGLLVHDNSLVEPVSEPFDAAPTRETLATAGSASGSSR